MSLVFKPIDYSKIKEDKKDENNMSTYVFKLEDNKKDKYKAKSKFKAITENPLNKLNSSSIPTSYTYKTSYTPTTSYSSPSNSSHTGIPKLSLPALTPTYHKSSSGGVSLLGYHQPIGNDQLSQPSLDIQGLPASTGGSIFAPYPNIYNTNTNKLNKRLSDIKKEFDNIDPIVNMPKSNTYYEQIKQKYKNLKKA